MGLPDHEEASPTTTHRRSHLPLCYPILYGQGAIGEAQAQDKHIPILGSTYRPTLATNARGRLVTPPCHPVPASPRSGNPPTLQHSTFPRGGYR
jgi:hypothetical protein